MNGFAATEIDLRVACGFDLRPAPGRGYLHSRKFFPQCGSAKGATVKMSLRLTQQGIVLAIFIAGLLCSAAFGLFPLLLPASGNPSFSLTAFNSAAPAYGLAVRSA